MAEVVIPRVKQNYRWAYDLGYRPGRSQRERGTGGDVSDPTGNLASCGCNKGEGHKCVRGKVHDAEDLISRAVKDLDEAAGLLSTAFGPIGDPLGDTAQQIDPGRELSELRRRQALRQNGAQSPFRSRNGTRTIGDTVN